MLISSPGFLKQIDLIDLRVENLCIDIVLKQNERLLKACIKRNVTWNCIKNDALPIISGGVFLYLIQRSVDLIDDVD